MLSAFALLEQYNMLCWIEHDNNVYVAQGLKALSAKQRQEEERATQHALGKLEEIVTSLRVCG